MWSIAESQYIIRQSFSCRKKSPDIAATDSIVIQTLSQIQTPTDEFCSKFHSKHSSALNKNRTQWKVYYWTNILYRLKYQLIVRGGTHPQRGFRRNKICENSSRKGNGGKREKFDSFHKRTQNRGDTLCSWVEFLIRMWTKEEVCFVCDLQHKPRHLPVSQRTAVLLWRSKLRMGTTGTRFYVALIEKTPLR